MLDVVLAMSSTLVSSLCWAMPDLVPVLPSLPHYCFCYLCLLPKASTPSLVLVAQCVRGVYACMSLCAFTMVDHVLSYCCLCGVLLS